MKPLISVIVPVYNSEGEIERCLDSIVSQTYPNLEIIVVDDGSTDSSGNILEKFATAYKNIKIIHQENSGVSAARNVGIDAAEGKYIGFVDSDDYIDPEMFETLFCTINETSTDLAIIGHFMHINKDWIDIRSFDYIDNILGQEKALDYLLYPTLYEGYMCTKLFKRDIISTAENGKELRLDEKIYICEDLLFVTKYILAIQKISYNPKPLYHYIIREGSALQSYGEKRNTELIARREMMDLFKPIYPELYDRVELNYIESSINLIRYAALDNRKTAVKDLKKQIKSSLKNYFKSDSISLKSKVRSFVIYNFPITSDKIWRIIKKTFRTSWEKPPKSLENKAKAEEE